MVIVEIWISQNWSFICHIFYRQKELLESLGKVDLFVNILEWFKTYTGSEDLVCGKRIYSVSNRKGRMTRIGFSKE